jgi:hypothetical protein
MAAQIVSACGEIVVKGRQKPEISAFGAVQPGERR